MAYIFGGNTGVTPEQLSHRRKVAEALAARAISSAPQNVGEGIAAVGQALASRISRGRLDRQEAQGRASGEKAFSDYFTSPAISEATYTGSGDFSKYRDAIASIESDGSGGYGAVGPEATPGGNRAYGRYQVMDYNIPEWTKQALGVSLTPEKFLADPNAQDATFDKIFGGYLEKGGPENAASMWFTGRPAAQGADKRDVLGTSGSDYVSRFMGALGGAGGAPAASGLDPQIMGLLSNPWLTEGQRAVAEAMLKQQMATMAPKDPIKVGKGDTLLDPNTYQPLYTPDPNAPGQGDEYGLNPIYGKDAEGNTVILQLGKSGTVNQPTLPEGFSPTPGVQRIDLGTAWGILDRSGNVVSTIPKDVAGERAAQEVGAASGKAQANLPVVEASSSRMLTAIDDLLTDPALPNLTGPVQSRLPTFRADTARAQSKLALIQGGTFLQAYNDLRGAGQITEQEGQAAKEAYNRLTATGMSDADFTKAIREFRDEVVKLSNIARARAGQPAQEAPTAPAEAPLDIPEGVDPNLWKYMTPEERALWQ